MNHERHRVFADLFYNTLFLETADPTGPHHAYSGNGNRDSCQVSAGAISVSAVLTAYTTLGP